MYSENDEWRFCPIPPKLDLPIIPARSQWRRDYARVLPRQHLEDWRVKHSFFQDMNPISLEIG
jgi:hypothetical protein